MAFRFWLNQADSGEGHLKTTILSVTNLFVTGMEESTKGGRERAELVLLSIYEFK